MQHHGCPTRLLDWTEGALTALYFVVQKLAQDDVDGIVYSFDPYELATKHECAYLPKQVHTSKALQHLEVRALGADIKAPLPFVPIYSNPRVLAQKKTVHPVPLRRSCSRQILGQHRARDRNTRIREIGHLLAAQRLGSDRDDPLP